MTTRRAWARRGIGIISLIRPMSPIRPRSCKKRSKPNAVLPALLYRLAFGPLEKLGGSPLQVPFLAPYFFAGSINQDEGGESLNGVFLGQLLILSLLIRGKLLASREIQFYQHQIFRSEVGELLFIQDFFVHFDAPRAPVRAGEIQQDLLILLRGFGSSLGEIGSPRQFVSANTGQTQCGGTSSGYHQKTTERGKEKKISCHRTFPAYLKKHSTSSAYP